MAQEQRDALQRLGLTEQDMRDVLDEAEAEAEEEARGGARRPGDDDENDGEEFDSDEDDAMQGRSQRPAAPARPDDNLSSEQRLRRTAARTALGKAD